MAHKLTPDEVALYWLIENGYRMVGNFDGTVAYHAQEAGLSPYKDELRNMMVKVLPILVMGKEGAPQEDMNDAYEAFQRFIAIVRENTEVRGDSHVPPLVNDIFLGWNACLAADESSDSEASE